MNRWILATLLALSALVNVVVIAKFAETRRDVDDMRRRGRPGHSAALDAPSAAPDRPVPAVANERRVTAPPVADAPRTARESVALPMLSDLDRFDDFWNALAKIEKHRETLGNEYQATVMEATAAFLGVDSAVLTVAARQMIAECDAAETDEGYALGRSRVAGLLRPESVRTHRFFLAQIDTWMCTAREANAGALSGGTFTLEPDK